MDDKEFKQFKREMKRLLASFTKESVLGFIISNGVRETYKNSAYREFEPDNESYLTIKFLRK